jgi:hypothetical protein
VRGAGCGEEELAINFIMFPPYDSTMGEGLEEGEENKQGWIINKTVDDRQNQ